MKEKDFEACKKLMEAAKDPTTDLDLLITNLSAIGAEAVNTLRRIQKLMVPDSGKGPNK